MAGEDLDKELRDLFLREIAESDSDATPPRFASCDFDGTRPINAKLGIEAGTDLLIVELDVPEILQDRVEVTLALMQSYVFSTT